MSYQHRTVCVITLAVGLLLASHVGAQNMVVNGTFDGDTSSWADGSGSGGTFAYDPLNYSGPAGSGSGLIEVTSTSGIYTSLAAQCIPGVSDAGVYDWGARVFIPSGQATTGEAFIQLVWYASTDCSGAYLTYEPFTNEIPHTLTDVWAPTRRDDTTPPATAQSGRLSLSVQKTTATAVPFRAHFDGVFFGLDQIPVELQHFVIE